MENALTTLTERGQESVPSALRKKLGLRPGQLLMWKMVSDNECRVLIVRESADQRGRSMRGFMKSFLRNQPTNTAGWMKRLREGDLA